jgi:hypothetical protein
VSQNLSQRSYETWAVQTLGGGAAVGKVISTTANQ